MKRKMLLIICAIISVIFCAIGFAACDDNSDSGSNSITNGIYYLYENGKLDKSQYIKLNGDKWSDDDGVNGTLTHSGSNYVFYAVVFGSKEEMYSGTLSDGVLTVKVFGATMMYCKEGSEPADFGNNQNNNQGTEKPDDKPKAEYTVTFDANGGKFADGETTVTQKAKEGDKLTAPSSPTRTASAFAGWATEKNGKTLWKFATDTVTKNITLYAVWEEQSATIISVDGASIDEKKMTVFMLVENDTESVSLSNKVVCSSDSIWKLYYDKLGQTEIPTKIAASKLGELVDGDNVFYMVVTSASGSQVNVYELTVHRSYRVAVNYYDNKENLIKTDNAYSGYEYKSDFTPSISGYNFNYWKDGSGKKVTEVTLYEPLKLYADCTAKTYTVSLNAADGNVYTKNVTYDKAFTLPTAKRTGYTFTGWYYGSEQITDASGNGLEIWTYPSDKTFSAGWTINKYSVTATVNDSKAGTVKVYVYSSSKPSADGKYDYNSKVTIEAITNSGYTFLGIYDKSGKKVNENSKLSYTTTLGAADESYTAKWIACPVTIERNDTSAGTVSYDTKTIAGVNTTMTASTNIGYTWLGWYNGETELTKELNYTFEMPTENVTYTAMWSMNESLSNFIFTSTTTTLTITGVKDKSVIEIVVPDNVTGISKGAFSGCNNLERIALTFIGETKNGKSNTFFGYIFGAGAVSGQSTYIPNSLKTVTIIDGVTSIGTSAFSGCGNLTSVIIPDRESISDLHPTISY